MLLPSLSSPFCVSLSQAIKKSPLGPTATEGDSTPVVAALTCMTEPTEPPPITMPPMFYFCYLVGARIMQIPPEPFEFELSFNWLLSELAEIWQPFLLGCFIVGSVLALAAFILMRILWHLHILAHIKERAERLHNRHRRKQDQP